MSFQSPSRLVRVLASLVAFGTLAAGAKGAEFFVSPSGSDSADGSLGAPFFTIGKALALAQPGDAVKLRAGTYREMINPVRGGTAGSPITIENYNGEEAIVSAFEVVSGPWTAQGSGVYATTVSGARPATFWTAPGTTTNGTGMVDAAGNVVMTVVNESTSQSSSVRSAAAVSGVDFFSSAVTWKVRGLSAASKGATVMPAANMNLYLSIASGLTNGFASEDAVNVYYRGDGRLALNVKKNTVNSWGASLHVVTDPAVNGYDLTLGPASAGTVPYTFTVKKSSGADAVFTGSWTVAQSEWSDGGTGTTSALSLFAQENVATTDVTQRFAVTLGSYTVSRGATVVVRDEFDDGDVTTVTEYPAATASSLSSGYDQVLVNGVMQDEARLPNKGAGTLMAPTTASVTVTNGSATTNPNTISSTSFGGQVTNFFAGARFVGGIGKKWSWQNAVVASSSGNLLTVDPATESVWWWPDYDGTTNTSDTGTGYVYGLRSLLDADGEWFLDQPTATLSLRMAGGVDPTGHTVEVKRRNWCVSAEGCDYLTIRGLKTIGGAIRVSGTGNVVENCDASHLSHFLVWTTGSVSNGGRTEGGGVVVGGMGNVVRGCTIHDTAGSGIVATGSGHVLSRNLLYNIDYSGTYAAPLVLSGTDITAAFNTIRDAGRDGIRPTGGGVKVLFNDVYNVGRLAHDLGAVYTFGTDAIAASGGRARIAYNWVHDRADTTDTNSKGIYLDNGTRNYLVDHNVVWNVASSTSGAMQLNSPAFGHEVYHNTVVGAGSYNDYTFTAYSSPQLSLGGYLFTDATHGLDIVGQNNLEVPDASATSAFQNYAAQDFTPKTTYSQTDERFGSTIATVNPPASTGTVSWTKAAGVTTLTNAYLTLAMTNPTAPFFLHEVYGHGQVVAGINTWVPDGQPDSGAYERGVARWVPGVNGWEGMKADTPVGIGARTAVVQGVRIALDAATPTNVTLCLGTTDGGTTTAGWESVLDLGTAAPGDVLSVFRRSLLGLTPGTTYYARFVATNVSGTSWSDAQSFTTAASLTWDAGGGASTGISTTTNWLADATPDLGSGGEIAIFGSGGSTATIDTEVALQGLVINRDGNFTLANGAGSLALGAGGITVTLPSTTARTHTIAESDLVLEADQTWSVTNNTGAAVLNVASSIGGAFGFTKTGTGSLGLSGNSTFDGAVNVNVGAVTVSHGNALGSTAGATTIAVTGTVTTGGQVLLSGGISSPENFVITGTTEAGSFARAIDNSSGTNTLTGSITLVGTGQVRLGPGAGVLNLDGPIARNGTDAGPFMLAPGTGAVVNVAQAVDLNGGAFNVTGPGTVVLGAASTDLGTTTIFFGSPATNGPTLKLAVNDALPTNRNLTIGTTGTSNGADRGTLDLAGFNQTVAGLTGSVGTGTTPSAASTRRITNTATGTLSVFTVGSGNAGGTFNGTIADGAGQVALVKVGTGTLTLPNANSYTGSTTVAGGTLVVGAASFADGAAMKLNSGAVLNLNFAGTDTVGSLTIDGVAQTAGNWGGLASGATYKTALIAGTGTLTVATGPVLQPYTSWAAANGLTDAAASALSADPDRDGMVNLLERIHGGEPMVASTSVLPHAVTDVNAVTVSFARSDSTEVDTALTLQWSADLMTWHDVVIGAVSSGPDADGVVVTIVENGTALDSVTVSIPRANGAGGKLFVRERAVGL